MDQRHDDSPSVEIEREDKVLFPDAGFTKGDLIDYYEKVAHVLLPHVKGRPLTLRRFPDGIGEEGFFQKEVPDHFPPWISRLEVATRDGGTQRQVVLPGTSSRDDRAALRYLANQATIELHVWLSRSESLRQPDRLVFDLDPPGRPFEPVAKAARQLRELLDGLELPSFLMLTGSRGAHVVVPLRPSGTFDTSRALARTIAECLASARPDELTLSLRKEGRGNRLFVDTTRNAQGQTVIAPYSVRALRGAPVATPLEWSELSASGLTASRYNVQSIPRRLGQKRDPWLKIDDSAVEPGVVAARVETLAVR